MGQRVRVTEYDPRWRLDYEKEKELIAGILGEEMVSIHHIGSTAVEGLKAKPVIDILPVVRDLEAVDALNRRFEAAGYECMGEFGIKGRRYYRKGGEERTHQIHIFAAANGKEIRRHLAFRDYLRSHPKVRREYGALKEALAAAHPDDIGAYCDGKEAFVKETEQKAIRWRRESLSKEELAAAVIDALRWEYPGAACTLDYNQAWKLLVSVRLAAQCTDARVNVVVEDLYARFPDVHSLACAAVDEIEKIVKPCGLGHSKARDISACMKVLESQYGGRVPDDFDELLKLPGVGRKSANLIMGDVFGKPAIVTDTHCIRLVNRMGLVDGIKEPKKVEMALWKIVPPEEGSDFCHRLVYHGRDVCTARTKPYCDRCCVSDLCAKNGVQE